ncbi:hypothetical protein HDU78_008818 [Chytriomyces hyalinus]|nr:hypothetical protein HDU78_008818 [Chytriomyces hyalinus]
MLVWFTFVLSPTPEWTINTDEDLASIMNLQKQLPTATTKDLHSKLVTLIDLTQGFKPPNLWYRPSSKLSDLYTGPCKINELIGQTPSCKLNIPSTWDKHPVLHPDYFNDNKHPLDSQPMKLRVIDQILHTRTLDNKQQVLISWKDHHPVFNCWLNMNPELLQCFQTQDQDDN